MPDLLHSLPSKDLGFLRIIASLWGLELDSVDPQAAVEELAEALCDADLVEEITSTLPAEGHAALDALVDSGGRMPWGIFTRQFGEIREMGPGRRDREQPHLHPSNASEILWYRVLLARAFFDAPGGAQEFAYIPDDLLTALEFIGFEMKPGTAETDLLAEPEYEEPEKIPQEEETLETVDEDEPEPEIAVEVEMEALGRLATPAEKAHIIPANDRILDDACTLLAAMRTGIEAPELNIPARVIADHFLASGLIGPNEKGEGFTPLPEPVKAFLEAPRKDALASLVKAWKPSATFNELRQLAGLSFEGEWKNEPLVTREFLLDLITAIPTGQWWSISAFIRDIKTKFPDYQRPAGDYDSWFIKRDSDGAFLRGFASWDEVDGALIRYFISGPMHWLGLLDLAEPEEGAKPAAFRVISNGLQSVVENGKVVVSSQGKISIPRLTPRTGRYQIARFCEWDEYKNDEYRYRITTKSLTRAKEQGLKIDHLLKLLQKYTASPIPPPFQRALQRWEINGTEARVESLAVLRVSKPEVLNELRAKAGRFLGEPLGPTAVVIKPGAEAKIQLILAEMGLLADDKNE
jgi:hypothetical protein